MGRYAVALLTAFMALNFADKAVFGLAAAPIINEFHLTNAQFGAIGSCFFVFFSLSALIVGRLGDGKWPHSWLAWLAAIWALAQAVASTASAAGTLVVSRLVLGAGEGPAFPLATHVAYGTCADGKRASLTAVILAGVPVGISLAALGLTPFVLAFGWRAAYALLAVLSVAWAVVWLTLPPAHRVEPEAAEHERLPMRALLGNRLTLGAMLGALACYLANAVALVWYPNFLVVGLGLAPAVGGSVLAAAWGTQIPVCLLSGWFTSQLVGRAADRASLYGRVGTIGVALTGVSLLGMASSWLTAAIACAAASLCAMVTAFISLTPLVAEVAPAAMRSTALGAFVAVYTTVAGVGPWLFGLLVDQASNPAAGYRQALLVLGTLLLVVAAACFVLCVHVASPRSCVRVRPRFERRFGAAPRPARGTTTRARRIFARAP